MKDDKGKQPKIEKGERTLLDWNAKRGRVASGIKEARAAEEESDEMVGAVEGQDRAGWLGEGGVVVRRVADGEGGPCGS